MTDKPTTKSVLIVAYHFPPDSAIGARRTEKFVRHLPTHGWQSHVLTVQSRYYQHIDSSLNGKASGAQSIVRTRMFLNPRYSYLKVKQLIPPSVRWRVSKRKSLNESVESMPVQCKSRWRRLLLSLMLLPDEKQGWVPFAFLSGLRMLRRHHPKCIYSSGPPWTTHIIALMLHTVTGVPWVADFRDPWSVTYGKPPCSTSRISERIEAKLQDLTYRKAAAVIANTVPASERLLAFRPYLEGKTFTVMNGFDSSEVSGIQDIKPPQGPPYRLVHAGTLFPGRDPGPFLAAFESLVKDGTIPPGHVHLEFLGVTEVEIQDTLRLMQRLSCGGHLTEAGLVSRPDCLKRMRQAHGLLLFDMAKPTQVAAKLFDYLLAKRPILDVTYPGSPSSDIIISANAGFAVDHKNHEELRTAIIRLLNLIENQHELYKPNEVEISMFDIKSLTGQLSEILDRVTCKCPGGCA